MKNISLALASASTLLLAQHSPTAHAQTLDAPVRGVKPPATEKAPWVVDTGLLLYQEPGRVSTVKPVLALSKDLGDERVLNMRWVFDTLSGASPNGAAPAKVAQTFTGPSGVGGGRRGYDDDEGEGGGPTVVAPGQLPKTPFKDNRAAFSLGWTQPLSATLKGSVGGNVSKESDYVSVGTNLGLSYDLNDKNTTLNGGLSWQRDTINPIGGTPYALQDVDNTARLGEQQKKVTEWMLGFTQVLNPKAFYQLSYSVSQANGYLTDPYKLLTLLDANHRLIAKFNEINKYTYLYEKRPNERRRQSLFNRIKFQAHERLIVDSAYRYTRDDWGVQTHTLDGRLRWDLRERTHYLEPHLRWYRQSAADFYTPYLVQGQIGPYASADARLGAFDAHTVGLKWGWVFAQDGELSLTLERYTQVAQKRPAPPSGPLAGMTLQPDLAANIFSVGYRTTWK